MEVEFITQDSAGNVEVLVYMYKCRYTAELQPFVYKPPITFVLKEYNQFFCGEKPYLSKIMFKCQFIAKVPTCLVAPGPVQVQLVVSLGLYVLCTSKSPRGSAQVSLHHFSLGISNHHDQLSLESYNQHWTLLHHLSHG
ncbi:hypothetical protein GOODEAATRI_009686 [Goodea atripinnis]|uniref:Uncharacterized protein n=1 Tax=Goodea atripinnis TaxID=208336 RepID=A0ABV0MQS7_9TELE